LIDFDDPARLIAHTTEPFFSPAEQFETFGFVPNVVFPTGVVRDGSILIVYYGAADTCTALAEFDEKELLQTLASLE
jgi:predicted GH43/DUF377 family glycosyl hydrolase